MATATKTTRGFASIRCPFCGCEDTLKVQIDDVSAMECGDCNTEVTPDDIRGVIADWQRLLAWLDTAPVKE